MNRYIVVVVIILASIILTAVSSTYTTSTTTILPKSNALLKWGAYVGDSSTSLSDFESLVGKKVDIVADFESWNDNFPENVAESVGKSG